METNIVRNIIMSVISVICLGLIIFGQRTVGVGYLALEFVGLIGLLVLLFIYNRKYK